MDFHPTRIVIYACVTDIDGFPQRRHVKIGNEFCESILNRAFNSTLHPAGYDHIHIPADFDSLEPLKRWFILDLVVTEPLSQEDVLHLPHQVYLASQRSGKLSFIPRDRWTEKAKERAASYTWGGKAEQKIVKSMQTVINNETE
ncbi:hypothetical protein N7447_008366 [Penicillium robsamsonii]|uniref:uncharacterized protein n=1 Tax=Penicillium robsamsonii TaxID=1792511 RepID=UPI0025476BB3|nr:uncharacterized protein N7447_008366 [Penicillium robsamsonii]KAJ5816133.1 hypothetical protein N7447_008366 [Penicillium robsamsonii]